MVILVLRHLLVLGSWLSHCAGLAYSDKKDIYVLLSDGELQEGSVWEASLLISSLKINNIVIVIDNNGLQSSTWAKDTHPTLNYSKNFHLC